MNIFRILWVEEEVENKLSDHKIALEMQGYDLQIVYNATEAENRLENGEFDLLLLDIRIDCGDSVKWRAIKKSINNNMFGLVLLEEIKNSPYFSKSIVFTNESWEDLKEKLMSLNFPEERFLQKRDADYPHELINHIVKNFPNLKINY